MPLDGERAAYASQLRWTLERFAETLEEVPAGRLDDAPYEGATSPAALAAHVAGAARAWIIGIGCGVEASRDRAAEFATSGVASHELAAALRTLANDAERALADVDPGRLDERLTPPQALVGASPATEIARREAIVSGIKHAAEHLGQLEVTRDLLARR